LARHVFPLQSYRPRVEHAVAPKQGGTVHVQRHVQYTGEMKARTLSCSSGHVAWKIKSLRSAPALGKNRTLESDFLNSFHSGGVVPLGPQQPLPPMRQAQPKLTIVFIVSVRSQFSALPDLILEEIGCFNHCEHHNKSPAHRGLDEPKTLSVGSCSDVMPPRRRSRRVRVGKRRQAAFSGRSKLFNVPVDSGGVNPDLCERRLDLNAVR